MEKVEKIKEQIMDLGFEIDKEVRKNSNTESEFARKTGRPKTSLNSILKSLKVGKGCNVKSIVSILNDLDKKIIIVDKQEGGGMKEEIKLTNGKIDDMSIEEISIVTG